MHMYMQKTNAKTSMNDNSDNIIVVVSEHGNSSSKQSSRITTHKPPISPHICLHN